MKRKLVRILANATLASLHIEPSLAFEALSARQVSNLHTAAKYARFRKPKGMSPARCYHQLLQRKAI